MKHVKKEKIEIEEFVVFSLAQQNNVERVAMALASSGYFVRITTTGTGYAVSVYKYV